MRGTARRNTDKEQQRRAANARIGEEMAWWIVVWWPAIRLIVPPVVLALGAWWVWTHYPHGAIAACLAALGVLLAATWGVTRFLAVGRPSGQLRHSAWHLVGVAGAVLLVGAFLVVA